MTVSSTTSRNEYNGNGSTDTFSYTFRILDQSHVAVYVDGVLNTITTDYSVTGVGVDGGGSIIFVTPPASGTANVIFTRSVPLTQETDYVENDPFPAESHEDALDKLTMIIQQQDEKLERTVSLAVTSTTTGIVLPDPEAGKALLWNAGAANLENSADNFNDIVTDAQAAASAASASAASAAASYDSFDDRYLGEKSSAPTLDNDGSALITGALYFDSVLLSMRVWNGSAWIDGVADIATAISAATNKATPVDADLFAIVDSAASFSLKNLTFANIKASLANSVADAGGTADAITADFTPDVALTNGTNVIVRAGSANATTTPTFAPDGLTAKTIVKGNNLALVAGDIAGAGHWLEMNFDTVLDKWVLQNPATSITPPSVKQIQPVTATQGSGALTFGVNPTTLDFRNTTLTNGVPTTITVGSLSLVLPSGGTLGAVSTVSARLILVVINNAGTPELAVVNIAGGNDLSETGVINTTAISASSTANNVFYSTTARTGVAYRVVGAIDAVNTAGAWGNPTLVQGYGGQALAAMSSLGYGQTQQNTTRTAGVTYYNTSSRPIIVFMRANSAGAVTAFYINGVEVIQTAFTAAALPFTFLIPAGGSYSYSSTSSAHNFSILQ